MLLHKTRAEVNAVAIVNGIFNVIGSDHVVSPDSTRRSRCAYERYFL
jgi:hypothetical protein